ncbi:hypothetical protein ACF0H5_002679 [Mactra antiquata]
MSSKVAPYFILTAEKVVDPNEIKELEQKHIDSLCTDVPTTPPSSRLTEFSPILYKGRKRGFVKYKIPVKEIRKKETLNKKMELIKEKLEQSRERFKEQKQRQTDLTISCDPQTNSWYDPDKKVGLPALDDADNLGESFSPSKENRRADGQPYVYFVVSDNINESAVPRKPKHSGKRRSTMKEKNESNKEKAKVKIIGLAREMGLKTTIELKPESRQGDPSRASVNEIVFPAQEAPKPQFPHNPKGLRSIPSPPRIPPGTPATIISGENKIELLSQSMDADETVPRKPFLSGPMYAGKTKGLHSSSLQHFDFPAISADQKRRALGLGTRFEEFAYPKPHSEQRQRKVSFADPLPVIRGSGFVLSNSNDTKDAFAIDTPALGPRAVTMGSIVLPSEQASKQTLCQKYLAGESVASARNVRKSCIPLPLPKIDIVSNVYDEMIIKMIQEYLQDTNTPTRQSQLARELLVHLQKHNEHMRELNVPNVNKKNKNKLSKAVQQHRQKVQELISGSNSVPPNTAEDPVPKIMTPSVKLTDLLPDAPNFESDDENASRDPDNQRSIPFVQITFKSKLDATEEANNESMDDAKQLGLVSSASKDRKTNSKPILSAVTPVSFQMAPPGLSKEDSFVSLPSMRA